MFDNQNNNNAQFENQQFGNGFYGDSGVETITGRKKGKKAAVIGGITAAALAGGCATAYAVSDTVKNQVKLRTMKPEKYYAWVCDNNSSTFAKKASDRYAKSIKLFDGGTGVDYNLSYDMPDSVKDQIKSMTGGDEDLNSIVDNIKNISLKMSGSMKDGTAGYNVEADLNGDKLATIEYDLNLDSMDMFMRCPELTEKWISADLSSLTENVTYDESGKEVIEFYKEFLSDPESVLSPADLEKEINKYIKVWSDYTKDVTIEKKESVKIGSISTDYTVAEVKLTMEDLKELSKKYIEEVKNDEIIKGIVVDKLGISAEDFANDLDDACKEITESTETGDLNVKTYIDATGQIRGISITDSNNKEVKAIIGKEDTNIRGEFSVTDEMTAVLTATENSDKSYSGDIKINSNGEEITVDFNDVKAVNEDYGYSEGTLKITVPDSDPINVVLSSDGKSQKLSYDLAFDGENYGKLDLSYAITDGSKVSLPDKSNAFVISEDNMDSIKLEDYVSQDELESFLKDIFTKIGMKDADEASKTISDAAFNSGSAFGSSGFDDDIMTDDWDDEDYDWDDADIDWDDFDFDYEGSDFDWDDYDFDFDENDLSIDIPELTTKATA